MIMRVSPANELLGYYHSSAARTVTRFPQRLYNVASQKQMPKSPESRRVNNEVLGRLWSDPDVRQLTSSMKEIMPNEVSEGELIIDYDHLIEGGYVGETPYFHIRLGRFAIYRAVAVYDDYWISLKLPRGRKNSLYSLFKNRS